MPVRFSAGTVADSSGLASFRDLIEHIVGICSEEEMIWTYAGRNIAGVEHAKPIRYFSVCENPCDSVRVSMPTPKPESAVTLHLCVARPDPAPSQFIDLSPESFLYPLTSHVTSLGSWVRGALGADYTVAPRLLYAIP